MVSLFDNSILPVLALTFLGSAILTGIIWFLGRNSSGKAIACTSVGIGFAWICAYVLGTPEIPPEFNSNAILTASVVFLVIGLLLDLLIKDTAKLTSMFHTIIVILCGIGLIAWMRSGIDFWVIPALLGWGTVAFSLQRVAFAPIYGSGHAALLLTIAASALGFIAWISDIIVDRDLAFGLAFASIAFYCWNLPQPRLKFGYAILLAGGGGGYMIALRLIEQAPPLLPAVIIIGFIFFADKALIYLPQKPMIWRYIPLSIQFTLLGILPLILSAIAALVATKFHVN